MTMTSTAVAPTVEPTPMSATIDQILHAAAQPLTALQGTIELVLLSGTEVNDYRNACRFSLKAAQRVTEYFNEMRVLLRSTTATEAVQTTSSDGRSSK